MFKLKTWPIQPIKLLIKQSPNPVFNLQKQILDIMQASAARFPTASPPLPAQQTDLVSHNALLQEWGVWGVAYLNPTVLCSSYLHDAVGES